MSIKVDDVPRTTSLLDTRLSIKNYEVMPNSVIKIYERLNESGIVSKELIMGGVLVEELIIKGDDLEAYYLRLIGGKSNA